MLTDDELRNCFPLIVTPSHDGRYFQNYVLSLLNTLHTWQVQGLRFQVFLSMGESLVTRARNNAVAHFLAHPEWTHLFWIDSDIGFSPEAAERLLRSGYDVAAGVYPLKRQVWPAENPAQPLTRDEFVLRSTRYTVNTGGAGGSADVQLQVQPDGFMALDEAPTGFMLIHRRVFERLMAAYPDLRYVPDSIGETDRGLHYRFFDTSVHPESKRYLSEDYTFCRLWSGLGGKVYVDANSNLSHHGSKLYTGSFAHSLTAALPYAVGAPAGAVMRLHGGEHLQPNSPGPEY